MSAADHYDAIVIGSGQGGTPLLRRSAEAGLRTALIERAHVGGTCINEGCTPTKTMVASARVAYLARRGADYGVRTGDVRVDMDARAPAQARHRRQLPQRQPAPHRADREPRSDLRRGQLHRPRRRWTCGWRDGSERQITAGPIFINAGARPAVPALEGLDERAVSRQHVDHGAGRVPEHLLVLGGGYVGLEFGQMFRRFGSRVTIVQSGGQLLGREDADVAQAVARQSERGRHRPAAEREGAAAWRERSDRIQPHRPQRRGAHGSSTARTCWSPPDARPTPIAEPAGRRASRPTSAASSRSTTGWKPAAGGIYALGDIKGGPAFTHISYDDFRILRTNLIEHGHATTTRPPRALHRLHRPAARPGRAERGGGRATAPRDPRRQDADDLRRARAGGGRNARLHEGHRRRRDANQILGAAVLGIEGGEVMSMLQLAMMGKLHYTALRDGVFAHPTLAESLNNLFTHFD